MYIRRFLALIFSSRAARAFLGASAFTGEEITTGLCEKASASGATCVTSTIRARVSKV